MAMQIRENGDANAQITDEAKEKLISWFEDREVPWSNEFLYHHYKGGEFVAISYKPEYVTIGDLSAVGSAVTEMVNGHAENKKTNDYCVWAHREWIESQ